ncbi:TRAP transporter substrate-binding protein DctP [Jannaschia aquimarina]|uniref:DctP_6 protein n=1 Tax=Jannaschia aquimarina TaxID=935700 RepID=A0A0D1CKP1_9RHOB|nr:TRAP transporter substrate-binding protein DctP [Jannaschia aquimarina]KIT15322.1 C4-dicarboxylate-binding periplasmic protein precursor [Jannaschia aquimarina]SNS51233.1 C4-dicarboxylate-binding protein DctP [Jannaschia aquimarina]
MNMKSLALAASVALTPVAAVADPAGCDPNEERLVFSHITAISGHPKGEAAASFAEVVNERMDGRYCVEVFGNSDLYTDGPELFEAMLAGEVHFAAPSMSKLSPFTPRFQLFEIPFLFDGPLHAMEFFNSDDARRHLLSELEDDGFYGLNFWSNGMRQLSADVPLRGPYDGAGRTFRVQASTPIINRQIELMGITPKKLAFKDVHDALASGEVQGQQNTWSNIYSKEFYLHQAAVTETNHTYLGYVFMTSTRFLDGLDPQTRREFVELADLVTHERNRFAYELNQMAREEILYDDGIVIRLSPDELQKWRDAFAPILIEFRDVVGSELLDAAMRINAETDPFN